MSNQHITMVRGLEDIKGPSRAILIVLADHANDEGECWLAHPTIAAEAGLGKSTIKKHLRLLKAGGRITWTERYTAEGDKDSNLYKLTLGGGAPRNPPRPPRNPPVGHDVTQGGAPRSYKASFKPQREAIELPFPSESFSAAWRKWEQHRKEIKKPLKPTSTAEQFKKLATWGEDRAIAAISHSLEKGWQGIYEPTNNSTTQPQSQPKDGTVVVNGQTYRTA